MSGAFHGQNDLVFFHVDGQPCIRDDVKDPANFSKALTELGSIVENVTNMKIISIQVESILYPIAKFFKTGGQQRPHCNAPQSGRTGTPLTDANGSGDSIFNLAMLYNVVSVSVPPLDQASQHGRGFKLVETMVRKFSWNGIESTAKVNKKLKSPTNR